MRRQSKIAATVALTTLSLVAAAPALAFPTSAIEYSTLEPEAIEQVAAPSSWVGTAAVGDRVGTLLDTVGQAETSGSGIDE